MDHRISYRIVLDTETAPCDKDFEGVSAWNMFVYDCGWAVVDKRGKVYRTRSFVNADIFLGEKNLMKSAYYANKIPNYWNEIKNSQRILTSFYNIRKTLMDDIEEFEVTQIFCHNCYFDYGSLTNTQRWETKSKYRYFFPKEIELMDTLKMARQVVAKTPSYQKFCEDHGYLTKIGRPKLTAEVLYRYITGETEFSENHTGLEDTLIEKEIMAYCYRKHKKMDGRLFKNRSVV